MKNLLISFGVSAIILSGSCFTVQATTPTMKQRLDFNQYVTGVQNRLHSPEKQWRSGKDTKQDLRQQRVVNRGDDVIGPMSYWGSLYTPEGEEWTYSAIYRETELQPYQTTIESATITIYDADFNTYKTFTADFQLGDHETTINSVQVAPQLTKKFFNINDAYEVMVYVHATTDDYTGHSYTQVYTLSDGSLVETLEGDCIGAVNTAPDPWSERYTLVFMREEYVITEDDYNYALAFDVYSRAGWSGGCKLEHTFNVDYALVAGAGNYALPMLINKHDNHVVYVLPRYEKPYFQNSWTDDVTPDNNFIIDLYDESFNLVRTTTIPMVQDDDILFSFPGLGELTGNDDISFGVYGGYDEPAYIIGVENYINSVDDFTTSLYVYDADGNLLKTIVENAMDYLPMSDISGTEPQYCFLFSDEDGYYFRFIDIISATDRAMIPLKVGDNNITTAIDRVPVGSSYEYISSFAAGEIDNADNVIHNFAWFYDDGSFDRLDGINLGKKVVMAMPYIQAEAINPYLFDTTDNYEYMFLVKEQIDDSSSRTCEYFRIYNDDSELILDMGPDEATGDVLSTIYLTNVYSTNPKLVVAYSGDNGYNLHYINLPFNTYAEGQGTIDDPYILTSMGEFMAIQSSPSAHYALGYDIDFGSTLWTGNKCEFRGTLDGRGHKLTNLNLRGKGIFEAMGEGSMVSDLYIEDVNIDAENTAGVICGYISGGDNSGAYIKNVHINNLNASGDYEVVFGAIAGQCVLNSVISDCTVTNAVISLGYECEAGGIVGGISTYGAVSGCLFDGEINAEIAGGIAGSSLNGTETISDCHVNADIKGSHIAGGIIGMSGRSKITHCYVDGTVEADGVYEAYSGGIAGYLKPIYEESSDKAIENCIVSSKSITASGKEAIAHRIVGFTSGDEWLVDWESDDPNVNWEDPSTYPYIPGEKEKGLKDNYAVGIDPIDDTVGDYDSTTEGKTLSIAEVTEDFLTQHGWLLGADSQSPWHYAGNRLWLYIEDYSLTVDQSDITIDDEFTIDNPAVITFTCASRYADYISVTSDDTEVAIVSDQQVGEDGKTLVCEIVYVGKGTCNIVATLGDAEAKCIVTASTTTISDIVNEENNNIAVVGNNVVCQDQTIEIYDVKGVLVASGKDKVSIDSLTAGTYIAVSGKNVLKFAK